MSSPPTLPGAVRIREVGLRDGLQMEPPVPTEAKLALLSALVRAGARRIEATAFVSPRAVPALADAAELARHLPGFPGVEFTALVPNTRGAERAVAAGIRSVEYVLSVADGHSFANTGRSSATSLSEVGPVATTVHAAGGACEVVLAVAWDCPFDGPTPPGDVVQAAVRAVELGADRICLADTIGTVTPGRMAHLLERVRGACPSAPVGIHLHDTRGAGLATAFAAMQLGVLDLDASIGGLGGCPFAPGASGNIATEELAYLCAECGVETGLDLEALIAAARLAQEIVGRPLSSGVLRAGVRRTVRSDGRL